MYAGEQPQKGERSPLHRKVQSPHTKSLSDFKWVNFPCCGGREATKSAQPPLIIQKRRKGALPFSSHGGDKVQFGTSPFLHLLATTNCFSLEGRHDGQNLFRCNPPPPPPAPKAWHVPLLVFLSSTQLLRGGIPDLSCQSGAGSNLASAMNLLRDLKQVCPSPLQ